MCVTIELPDQQIDTCGELADLVGGMDELPDGCKPEQCLCGADADRLLLDAGYWVRKNPFGYEARKGTP